MSQGPPDLASSAPTVAPEAARERPSLTGSPPAPDSAARRRWRIEIGLVILLAVLPDFYNAIGTHVWPIPDSDPAAMTGAYAPGFTFAHLIIRALQIVPIILYLIWRSGEPWSSFGFKRVRWFDPLAGVGTFLSGWAMWYGVWIVLWILQLDQSAMAHRSMEQDTQWAQSAAAVSGADWLIIICGGVCNGVAEEVALYGFLFPRIRQAFGLPAAMIGVPILFTSYHVYYDPISLLGIAVFGIAHMLVYTACRRVWPLIVSHIIGDLIWLTQG